MKKDLNLATVSLMVIGIIWFIAAMMPDYTALFNY